MNERDIQRKFAWAIALALALTLSLLGNILKEVSFGYAAGAALGLFIGAFLVSFLIVGIVWIVSLPLKWTVKSSTWLTIVSVFTLVLVIFNFTMGQTIKSWANDASEKSSTTRKEPTEKSVSYVKEFPIKDGFYFPITIPEQEKSNPAFDLVAYDEKSQTVASAFMHSNRIELNVYDHSKENKIYLNLKCQSYSDEFGHGAWSFRQNRFEITFRNKTFITTKFKSPPFLNPVCMEGQS